MMGNGLSVEALRKEYVDAFVFLPNIKNGDSRTDPFSRAHFDQWLTFSDNNLADTRKLQSAQFCQLKYLIYGIRFDGDEQSPARLWIA